MRLHRGCYLAALLYRDQLDKDRYFTPWHKFCRVTAALLPCYIEISSMMTYTVHLGMISAASLLHFIDQMSDFLQLVLVAWVFIYTPACHNNMALQVDSVGAVFLLLAQCLLCIPCI